MSFQKVTEILTNPDVLIIGGGAAGVAAAAGASQSGASVTLLEKNAFAGGKATAAYVGTICGLYYRSENPVPRYVHDGFPKEFALQLMHKSKSNPYQYKHGLHFLPYEHFQFMLLCDEWLKKSTQSVCFHTQVMEATLESGKIIAVDAISDNKRIHFHPKAVIDTSGEDLMAHLLEIGSIISDHYQAAAHVFQLSGVADSDGAALNLGLIRAVQKGIVAELLAPYFEKVSIVPGSLNKGNVLLKLPLPLAIDSHPNERTNLELFSRNAIHELVSFLVANTEAFKHSTLTFVAQEAGVRTGPRHTGKYILQKEDVLQCKKPGDTIAAGAWPIEFWEPGKNVSMEFFNMDDFYGIPSGAIQSAAIGNLFFSGRNISASDSAVASARVIGTCLATGYAAGMLAAAQSLNKSHDDTVRVIQQSLSISPKGS